jgi:hypothetical protein
MRQLVAFLFSAIALRAGDDKPLKPELPESVRPIVDLARAASPELFAKVVAHLVEAGKIPKRESQIDLLEQAFAVAGEAKEPYRLMAIPATPQDTRALYRSKAGELNLDVLSLRSRIVIEMLRIDRVKARALFDQIARPALDPRPCEDPLVADVSAFYEMAGAIAQSGFTASEKQKSAHVQFLESVLGGAQSPGELLPFLRALKSVDVSPPQRDLLMGALAAKLESIGADYRPFAMTLEALSSEIERLSSNALTRAFHNYQRTQAAAPRCLPDFGPKVTGETSEDEIVPSKHLGNLKVDPYFQSGDSKQIADELVALRNLPRHGRPEGEWSNRLADFLRDLVSWSPSGDDVDAFHQRATMFRALLEITPRGEDHDRVLAASVAFLESSEVERESPAEWLYQVRMLTEGPGFDAPAMLTRYRVSSSIGLTLYAALDLSHHF